MGFQIENKKKSFSEINVTPFVDVVLVLLVIFMITAPLMYNGIRLDLPKTKKVHQIALSKEQIILSMAKTGEFFLGKDKILPNELVRELEARLKKTENKVLYLRADYSLKYEQVAKTLSYLKGSGLGQIALVTEVEK